METLAAQFRERFWSAQPPLPPGVLLERLDSFAVAQRGPSGTSVFDLVELRRREQRVRFLAAYRPRVLAGEAITSKKRLRAVIDELRLRDARGAPPHPMIITGQIGPKAIDVCQREGLAVIDGRERSWWTPKGCSSTSSGVGLPSKRTRSAG